MHCASWSRYRYGQLMKENQLMISYRRIFNDYSRDEEYKFYCQFQHQHYYNNVFVKILPDEESHYERFPGGAAP